jgi:hypothetical protein
MLKEGLFDGDENDPKILNIYEAARKLGHFEFDVNIQISMGTNVLITVEREICISIIKEEKEIIQKGTPILDFTRVWPLHGTVPLFQRRIH